MNMTQHRGRSLQAGMIMVSVGALVAGCKPREKACPPGQFAFKENAGHCCWQGQRWTQATGCAGQPSECPEGLVAAANACEAPRCATGQRLEGGRCCWSGQTYSDAQGGRCVGTPQCPAPLKTAGDTCEDPTTGYVLLSPGRFMMGSPPDEVGRHMDETQHEVHVSRAFWMKKTEVTWGEWTALMGEQPAQMFECGPTCPVGNISWFQALEYLNALSRHEQREQCYVLSTCGPEEDNDGGYDCAEVTFKGASCTGYRLPSEVEWEYAARAGDTRATYNGELTLPLGKDPVMEPIAWYYDNGGHRLSPVGKKRPNAWGLHDMLGNAWEWTGSEYERDNTYTDKDIGAHPGPESRYATRVYRSGSVKSAASFTRAAARNEGRASQRDPFLGFRPVRSF